MSERRFRPEGERQPVVIHRGVPVPMSSFLDHYGSNEIVVEGIPGMGSIEGSVEVVPMTDMAGLYDVKFLLGTPVVKLTTERGRVEADRSTAPIEIGVFLENLRKMQLEGIRIELRCDDTILYAVRSPEDPNQILQAGTADYISSTWSERQIKYDHLETDFNTFFPKIPNVLESAKLVIDFEE